MKRDWLRKAAIAALMATTPLSALSAETLQDALASAYASNPQLTAQRAIVRQLDEGVAQAVAGGRPSITGTVALNQDFKGIGNLNSEGRSLNANADFSLPVFSGGRVRNSIRAAEERVQAGRQDLRTVENQVFTDVVTAYMDVLRDQSVVELNQNQVKVLEEQLRASRDRFEVGDLTRTDVAQSEARLATAQANLTAALGQLTFSREAYRRVVGRAPGTLEPPPPLPSLPGTAEQAVDLAVANNPASLAARREVEATRYDVGVARAGRLPTVAATTGIRYSDALGTLDQSIPGLPVGTDDNDTSQTAGVRVSVPLYQSGAVASRVRQAQARRSQALEQSVQTERVVVANARNAFEGVQTSRATIQSAEVAVRANELALEGTRQENLVGSRNVLDVLNAEQELLNSRVSLVRARRDEYVAGFQLLAAIGRAEAEDLNLQGPLYDPNVNYRRVRNSWSDWADDETPRPVANSTAPNSVTNQDK